MSQVPTMIPSKSGKICCTEPKLDQDLISNLPGIAIDEILKKLPIKKVAQMSILSTNWRQIWLSYKYLVFDYHFLREHEGEVIRDRIRDDDMNDDTSDDISDYTSDFAVITNFQHIISSILFHHVGSVHKFSLGIHTCEDGLIYSGWLSLLSKVGVKKLVFQRDTMTGHVSIPSYIYDCKDLVKLNLWGFILNRAPNHFKGFGYLRSLDMMDMHFDNDDVFSYLIAHCPRLTFLKVQGWTGMNHVVIDGPSLESLIINGVFKSIVFKNARNLSFVSLHLSRMNKDIVKEKGDGYSILEMLARLCQLEELHCSGDMSKFLGASCITTSPTLNFLQKLHLRSIDLSNLDDFCFTLSMIQCCPFIKILDLEISEYLIGSEVEHEFDYEHRERRHLIQIIVTGLTGSDPELELIEYLLSIASNLEILAFKCNRLDPISELKVTRNLLELPRASPKAKVICMEK